MTERAITKADLDARARALQARVLELKTRYQLEAPPNVKPARAELEQTLKPDLTYLLAELAFAWKMMAQFYEAAGQLHAKVAELTAPKVMPATVAQMRQIARAEVKR